MACGGLQSRLVHCYILDGKFEFLSSCSPSHMVTALVLMMMLLVFGEGGVGGGGGSRDSDFHWKKLY